MSEKLPGIFLTIDELTEIYDHLERMIRLWDVKVTRTKITMKHPIQGHEQQVKLVPLRNLLDDELKIMFKSLSHRQRAMAIDGFFGEMFVKVKAEAK